MSANLVVDLNGTCLLQPTIALGAVAGSGIAYAASGGIIGQSVNARDANTMCQVVAQGCPLFTSGQLRLQVQTADADTSGLFTDPTSGLPVGSLPTAFQSGGILVINSGGVGGGLYGPAASGQNINSGFLVAAGFQRLGQFVRVNMVSGDFYGGTLNVGILSNLKTTGSGGGFSFQPTSGAVNV